MHTCKSHSNAGKRIHVMTLTEVVGTRGSQRQQCVGLSAITVFTLYIAVIHNGIIELQAYIEWRTGEIVSYGCAQLKSGFGCGAMVGVCRKR